MLDLEFRLFWLRDGLDFATGLGDFLVRIKCCGFGSGVISLLRVRVCSLYLVVDYICFFGALFGWRSFNNVLESCFHEMILHGSWPMMFAFSCLVCMNEFFSW